MPRELSPLEIRVREYASINKTALFLLICIVALLLQFISQTFIINEIPAFQFMEGSQLLIFKIISNLSYLGIPLYYGFKITLVGFILWTGCFLWGYKVTFKQCWHVALFAELIFFIPTVIKLLWFLFVDTNPTYWDVKAFYPLSYMNLFNHQNVAEKYWYVNTQLNLFEVGYWILLCFGIDFAARKKKSVANAIVFTTYVPLFFFWLWFYLGVSD